MFISNIIPEIPYLETLIPGHLCQTPPVLELLNIKQSDGLKERETKSTVDLVCTWPPSFVFAFFCNFCRWYKISFHLSSRDRVKIQVKGLSENNGHGTEWKCRQRGRVKMLTWLPQQPFRVARRQLGMLHSWTKLTFSEINTIHTAKRKCIWEFIRIKIEEQCGWIACSA